MDDHNMKLVAGKMFYDTFGESEFEFIPLPVSGSDRRYFRLRTMLNSAIFCYSGNIGENHTFISLARVFRSNGLNVPQIYAVSVNQQCYLQQDLGDVAFLDIIKDRRKRDGSEFRHLIDTIFGNLSKIQFLPSSEWNQYVGFEPFNEELIDYDFQYALTNFISHFSAVYNGHALKEEFEKLKHILLSFPSKLWGFMYRDFQSRNIMIKENQPWFIDFQSGRKGPCIYDFVSFAWQAKAGFSTDERRQMFDIYLKNLKLNDPELEYQIKKALPYWALFRMIQVLGAYGLRGLKQGKKHFIESIPLILNELKKHIELFSLNKEFPQFTNIICTIDAEYSSN